MRAEAGPTASSSRRTAVKGLLGLAAALATGSLVASRARVREPAQPASREPLLVWNEGSAALPPRDAAHLSRALWLVLSSLGAETRTSTLSDIGELIDGIEARHLPLGLDLSDDPPAVIARRLQKALLPSWTAARSLVQGTWSASDGSLSVRVAAPTRAASTQGISVLAWSETERNTLAARARFLAWPVSNAVLLDAGSPAAARDLGSVLRASVTRESGLIGLVLDAGSQNVTALSAGEPERLELETRLRRFDEAALKKLGDAEPLARALRAGLPAAPSLPWLELHASELLVVPRLSSLARRPRFLSELDQSARRISPNARRVST